MSHFLDRLIAFILFVIFLPILFVISIFSYLFQGRGIFFIQKRLGYKKKIFKLIKFRTMVPGSPEGILINGLEKKITKFGQFLRITKLDELTQLINVLRGDMSIIGPRPELPYYLDADNFAYLDMIKPGLSGFSSILFRNEDKILLTLAHKSPDPYALLFSFKQEIAKIYSFRRNYLLDLKLIVLTVVSLFTPKYAQRVVIRILSKYLPNHFMEDLELVVFSPELVKSIELIRWKSIND